MQPVHCFSVLLSVSDSQLKTKTRGKKLGSAIKRLEEHRNFGFAEIPKFCRQVKQAGKFKSGNKIMVSDITF